MVILAKGKSPDLWDVLAKGLTDASACETVCGVIASMGKNMGTIRSEPWLSHMRMRDMKYLKGWRRFLT